MVQTLGASEADRQQLASCSSLLVQSLGMTEAAAHTALARAFGWGNQAYWRGENKDAVPDPARVTAVLSFLQDTVGLSPEEVGRVVKVFPEVLGQQPDLRLAENTRHLDKQWKITGAALKSTVQRRPQILGYNVDCAGDCVGECNRWASLPCPSRSVAVR